MYFKARRLNIEIYTDRKDVALEERAEAVLDGYGIFYEKSEVWIESEKLDVYKRQLWHRSSGHR